MKFKREVVHSVVYEVTEADTAIKQAHIMKRALPANPPQHIILTLEFGD